MIRTALAVLVALTLASPAFAGDPPPKKGGKGGGPGHGPDWDQLVKHADKDGDGQLSKDELTQAKADREKNKPDEPKAPEGGDPPKKGKKGGKGGKGGEKGGDGPLIKHFDEIDSNKDGKISKDEFTAFVEKQKEKHAEGKKGKKGEQPKPEEPKPEEPKK